MFKSNTRTYTLIALLALLYLAGTAFVRNPYYLYILTIVPIYGAFGVSWNLLGGYAGVVSFGHAAFFGLGAYTVTILFVRYGVTPWVGIPAGAVVGSLAGGLIGYPTLRLRGVHFALAMLAYPSGLRVVFEWLGLQEVAFPRKGADAAYYMQFDDPRIGVVLSIVLLVVTLVVSRHVENSRHGLCLRAIKQNEQAAEAAGIDIWRRKIITVLLSSAIAGAAGGLYVVSLLVTTPDNVFGMMQSAQAMVVTLFGGVGALWGPVIGAGVLIPLGESLHLLVGDIFPGIDGIVYGVALMAVVLVAPEGIYWSVVDWRRRRSPTVARQQAEHESLPIASEAAGLHAIAPVKPGMLLSVKGLSRSFSGVQAVQDVSFEVPRGIILGIIGQNGAGKTTLFNLLNGFVAADHGEVILDGDRLIGRRPDEVCRFGAARTFQVARAFLRMSIFDNVAVGAFVATSDDEEARKFTLTALGRVGLLSKAAWLASELNSVEVRLMELARALASKPKLLLLDETLAGLGHQEVEIMLAIIRRLPEDGTTVLLIEHTMHAVLRLSDQLLVLDHGCVIASGDPRAVMANPRVIEAYLGKKWMAQNAAA